MQQANNRDTRQTDREQRETDKDRRTDRQTDGQRQTDRETDERTDKRTSDRYTIPARGVVVNFDLGERFPRPRPQQRGSLRPTHGV